MFVRHQDYGSNPHDLAPGYMPILEYRWCGSTGGYSLSGCTVIAFYENSRKNPGALSETRPANRVMGATGGTKNGLMRKSETKKPKKE